MFTARFKTILLITILFVMISFSVMLYADCDMMAMLSTDGSEIHELDEFGEDYPDCGGNDPYDFLYDLEDECFFEYQTGQNDNGYGIIYYHENDNSILELNLTDENNQVFRSDESLDYTAYTWAKYRIWNEDELEHHAVIVFAHNRQASMNPDIDDPHPFIWDYELTSNPEMPCYSFEHNGTIYAPYIDDIIGWIETLFPAWLVEFPFRTPLDPGGNGVLVDSEVYFHWIMANIKASNGNVLLGLHNAVKAIKNLSNSQKNFIFSDGSALYAFRDYGGSTPSEYYLGYYDGLEEDDNPFRAVRSDVLSSGGLEEISQHELVYIPRQGDIIRYKKINFTTHEISGIVSGTWTSDDSPYYVIGDVTVDRELTIESDVQVFFLDECEFTINGTVNLMNGSEFNLSHGSSVFIDGTNAELILNWGSTITGFTPTTYDEEEVIPGDRIIAQYGGIITTSDDYQHPGDKIIIKSSSGELWDGIFIQNPDDEINYWFVNCDISGIRRLSIEMIEESENIANLKLYLTDFHDAGQILARHGHRLFISGVSAFTRCIIRYNHETPIAVYDSPVNIDYALIEDNGRDMYGRLLNSSCDGIYLSYSASLVSEIKNTIIRGNTGCGIQTYGQDVNIENNTIEYNEQHGLLTKKGTFNFLRNTTILDNFYAEYVGCQESYNWADEGNTIEDDSVDPLYYYDQYILMAHDWDEILYSIDVRGNYINHENNEHRFSPRYEAFHFDAGGIPPEREMLYSALDEMRNENYDDAESIFQQIISGYPDSNEAATSIRGLFFIENYTDKDYASLRSYIDNIQVSEATSLYKAKEDVKTKLYMKEEDYVTAIERLEVIINNPPSNDELIYAMIDEGYCYLQLEVLGLRDIPAVCTVKPRSFDEYQRTVQELENGFSFFTQPENNDQVTQSNSIILHGNYPNPFNPSTNISFDISSESDVSITVYNVKGQKVTALIDKHFENGSHTVTWDGKDNNNKSVSSGIYFYKVSTEKSSAMKKMLLLK